MAKATSTNETPKQTVEGVTDSPYLLNTTLKFPEDYKGPLKNEGLKVVLNRESLELFQDIFAELCHARDLPHKDEDISVSDALTLVILAEDRRINEPRGVTLMTGEQAAKRAKSHYATLRRDAEHQAYILAMTWENPDIDREPLPYNDQNETAFSIPKEKISWLKGRTFDLPPVRHDLSNPYERRFKQISDILIEAGPIFRAQVDSLLKNDLANKLREAGLGEPVDPDGFPA